MLEPTIIHDRVGRWLTPLVIFLSAFLLFSVEPLVAKRMLPWFGGSAGVWATSLAFFQIVLLAGYAYSVLLSRRFDAQQQAIIHICLLAFSLLFLPVGPGSKWIPATPGQPGWHILLMLSATLGVPYFVLSATSPLLQHWRGRKPQSAPLWRVGRLSQSPPYWLFALSNAASLLALLSYPFAIERWFTLSHQSSLWSIFYVVFALTCGAVAWTSRRDVFSKATSADQALPIFAKWTWFALSAGSSTMLLAVTNQLSENVAAVPFLWILPLSIYLLTFVLCFGTRRFYNRAVFLRVLALGLGLLGYRLYDIRTAEALQLSIPIFAFGLFACCIFCHGELSRRRPPVESLTTFYVTIALGGAAGALFVAIVAPYLFSGVYEFPLSLVAIASIAAVLTWQEGWALRVLWLGVTACMIAVLICDVRGYQQDALALRRSFYGSLRVIESRRAGDQQLRTLFHGTITHGSQFRLLPRRTRPTTYYGYESGIGIVLREVFTGPKRVGIIGLGAGTLAAYGEPGDEFYFYEINHQVVEIAQSLFTYLRDSKARVELVEGDARLSLARDPSPGVPPGTKLRAFDVLAVDAFSGDAIPVHLLTQEAMVVYLRHLKPDGVLAVHVSNQYLDLAPVVKALADRVGYKAVLVRNHTDINENIEPADWVLVTRNPAVAANPSVMVHEMPINESRGRVDWTDNFSNLFWVLRPLELK